MKKTRMAIEDAFLHDILTHPDDDAPRLIYADWLEEHNNPRGEFIRAQCALAQLAAEDPRRWPLEQRERELLASHESEWLPRWNLTGEWRFRRGFIEEITLTPEEYLAYENQLFKRAPIRHLRLRSRNRPRFPPEERHDRPMARVAESPYLACLSGLSLAPPLDRQDLHALIFSPHLRGLTELRLTGLNLHEDTQLLSAWCESSDRPRLRHLDLTRSRLPPLAFRRLVQSPLMTDLETLNLAQTELMLDILRLLVHSAFLPALKELNLNGNRLTLDAIRVLPEGRLLNQLETLHLDANLLGDSGADLMRGWPALPRLSRLSLVHNQLFTAGIAALSQAPALSHLISLDLFDNISCDTGAKALASSSHWERLRTLNLRFNGVGDKGVRALAASDSMPELTWLNLSTNGITSEGANALTDSPYLRRLARLDLLRNDIGPVAQTRLRERFGPHVYC
jgi:uncharacterized protein (TIGR02996 family)